MDPAALLLALQLALAPCRPAGVDDIYTRAAHRAVTLYWAPARRYLWCALVAQAGAESDWRADAVSPAGAAGPVADHAGHLDRAHRAAWLGGQPL